MQDGKTVEAIEEAAKGLTYLADVIDGIAIRNEIGESIGRLASTIQGTNEHSLTVAVCKVALGMDLIARAIDRLAECTNPSVFAKIRYEADDDN